MPNEPISILADKVVSALLNLNYAFGFKTDFRDDRLDILQKALETAREIRDEATQGGVTIVQI